MPNGTYLHLEEGTEERFQCAPGPGGWRYVGERSLTPTSAASGHPTTNDPIPEPSSPNPAVTELEAAATSRLEVGGAVLGGGSEAVTEGFVRGRAQEAGSVRVDLVVDSRWRQIRLEIVTPSCWVRGGVTGPAVAWVRGAGEEAAEHSTAAVGFTGESPAFLVATARFLALEPGEQRDVRLVRFGGTLLSALTVAERWRLVEVTTHETDTAPLPVERYEIADLSTGEVRELHLAGDVVLAGENIELTELESPPNL